MSNTWANNTIWWHVYPLGFTGAPIREWNRLEETTTPTPRLRMLIDWLDYAIELGVNGLLLGPIFDSSTHGYDTLDHFRIDPRLGDESDFDALIAACHQRGIRVVLDGVFSHVGREHPLVQEALATGPDSGSFASSLFDIDWHTAAGPRPRVWEGHESLVRFKHSNPQTINYVIDVMAHWLNRGIDGWRLDAAYSVPNHFWSRVLDTIHEQYPHTWILGEVLHGDYARFVADSGADTVTQYELWKSIWSSIKDKNFFELDWTLKRHNDMLTHFIPNTFIGNHDVTRIASQVGTAGAIGALTILMTVGGIPSIYYGDEQGYTGIKRQALGGDDDVRPRFPALPEQFSHLGKEIYEVHRALIAIRRQHPWLANAHTEVRELTNERICYRSTPTNPQTEPNTWLESTIDLTDDVRIIIADSTHHIWHR
ncbi:MAG: alpha-amylase [Actinomycetaceae bacterium]|nr:alpha-amylase [Actinomycetaceae bacterium]